MAPSITWSYGFLSHTLLRVCLGRGLPASLRRGLVGFSQTWCCGFLAINRAYLTFPARLKECAVCHCYCLGYRHCIAIAIAIARRIAIAIVTALGFLAVALAIA